MRVSRLRAGLAGILGMTLIGIATPAWATVPEGNNPTPVPTTTTTASPTTTPTSPADAVAPASPQASPTQTGAAAAAEATASPTGSPTSTPTPGAAGSATPTHSPTATPAAGTDPLDDLREFMASLGIHFPDVEDIGFEDFVINPLGLSFTCKPDGTHWKLANHGAKPLGVGWFSTDLDGDFIAIAAGQTLDLPTTALAVIAHPVDEEGNVLVTVPAVGVSSCEGSGSGAGAGAPGGAAPAATPVAAAATPVKAEPHFTG